MTPYAPAAASPGPAPSTHSADDDPGGQVGAAIAAGGIGDGWPVSPVPQVELVGADGAPGKDASPAVLVVTVGPAAAAASDGPAPDSSDSAASDSDSSDSDSPRTASSASDSPDSDVPDVDWSSRVTVLPPSDLLGAHGLVSGWPALLPPPVRPAGTRPGDTTALQVMPGTLPAGTVLLLGLGALPDPTRHRDLRRAGASLARAVRGRGEVHLLLPPLEGSDVQAVVEGFVLGGYVQPGTGLTREPPKPLRLVLHGATGPSAAEGLRRGLTHAAATVRARDLAVTPSNVKSPAWVAARALEGAADGLRLRVRDVAALRAEGFDGLVVVGAASATPPVLVELDYVPVGEAAGRRPVVLVGKGITYDTGGLSIKPREAMVPMKTDMSGAAAVLAVLRACREAGVRRRVIGLLPLAENAVGASSYRPSDVITHYGGRTVEVANTDAEGRLVLADALAYAVARLDPVALVDIATLTGAVTLGLGRRHAALYATDEALADGLMAAGAAAGELMWRMPLVEEYSHAMDSSVADLRHVPEQNGIGGGSITAALFLREFAGDVPWAHLDVAGTSRADKDEYEVCRGATGWGARLLLRWLESLGESDGDPHAETEE